MLPGWPEGHQAGMQGAIDGAVEAWRGRSGGRNECGTVKKSACLASGWSCCLLHRNYGVILVRRGCRIGANKYFPSVRKPDPLQVQTSS